MDLRTVQGSCT